MAAFKGIPGPVLRGHSWLSLGHYKVPSLLPPNGRHFQREIWENRSSLQQSARRMDE